ncbi:MAG: phosphoadenylyl-sulfate reductase [Terriglobia bacterium]
MGNQFQVANFLEELGPLSASEIISRLNSAFGPNVAFATSLGLEDQVLIHLLAESAPQMRVFTLDTGRLFNETYELIEKTESRYGIRIEIYCPETSEVEAMVREHGINLFYQSIENRKLCCAVRKLRPLGRALKNLDAWVCGLRRGQGVTRQQLDVAEWDANNQILKFSPLWNWTDQDIQRFIQEHKIPYNPLHDQGFLSIGCSCCTRAVKPGEDLRAGRWWWEAPEHKECGLHRKDGKPLRP